MRAGAYGMIVAMLVGTMSLVMYDKRALNQQTSVTVAAAPAAWYAANDSLTDCIQTEHAPGKYIAYFQGEGETVTVEDHGAEIIVDRYHGGGITEVHFFRTYAACVAGRITPAKQLAARYQ